MGSEILPKLIFFTMTNFSHAALHGAVVGCFLKAVFIEAKLTLLLLKRFTTCDAIGR